MAQVTTSAPADTVELGKRLRAIRRRKGLSLNEVARGAGLTRRELVAYERGKAPIPDSDLWCIAGSCGIDVSELQPSTPPSSSLAVIDGSISVTDTIAHLRNDLARREAPALEAGDSAPGWRNRVRPASGRRKPRAIEAGSPAPATTPTTPAPTTAPVETPIVPEPTSVFAPPPPAGATVSSDPYAALAALPEPVALQHDEPLPDMLAPPPPPGTVAFIEDEPLEEPVRADAPILVDPVVVEPAVAEGVPTIVSGADAPPIDVNAWTPIRAHTDTRETVDVGANAGFWNGADPWSTPATDAWNAIEAEGWTTRDSSPWSTTGNGGWGSPTDDSAPTPTYDAPGDSPWARVEDDESPWSLPPATWQESDVPTHASFAVDTDSDVDETVAPIEASSAVDEAWQTWAPAWGTVPDPEAVSTGFYVDWGTDEAPVAEAPDVEASAEAVLDLDAPIVDVAPTVDTEPFGFATVTEPEVLATEVFEPAVFEPEAEAEIEIEEWAPFFTEPEPTRIVWHVDGAGVASDDVAAEDATDPTEIDADQFVVAGADWHFGQSVPPVEVSDGGGLVMRRADERWALADVIATGDFVVEVELDYRSGPGFGVLFRAELDADDRMSGYSFDIDPAYEGGCYLVRQWIADRELWNPIARVPMEDPNGRYGAMTVRVVVEADRMTALVNGEEILAVDDLSAASAGRGHEAPVGTRVGIQSWSSTDMVLDVLRVAAR